MSKSIGFFTGARSDYGIMKNFIKAVKDSENYSYHIFISGMHLLKKFGNTLNEIKSEDGFSNYTIVESFSEDHEPGYKEFVKIITALCEIFSKNKFDAIFLLGDRFETYAAALACHFCNIPIIHSGGGTITRGAVDNIYRYNISNLATYHFATSKGNFERLKSLPVTENENVFFTGSFAIDAIRKFQLNPRSISEIVPELEPGNFCLMTFHPATKSSEDVAEVMDTAIGKIKSYGKKILITYPNNDPGYKKILTVIEKWSKQKDIIVREHLGALGYYSALSDCIMVVGNSSSGIVEAPYFNKPVLNIGSRQEGREADEVIHTVPCNKSDVLKEIELLFSNFESKECNCIYGNGDSIERIFNILEKNIFKSNQL